MAGSDFVEVAGGRIEYRWYGRPVSGADEPVVVLLHEGLGCVDLWRDFPDRLAAALDLRVLAYSRYGYGRSAPCRLPRPISYMHDEGRTVLPELLSALKIGPHLLVGHSDGGSIALAYAALAARPGLVGVVTMAAHIFAETVSIESIARAREAYERGSLRAALARHHGDNVDCAFRGWADAWLSGAFDAWSLVDLLPRIEAPCLVIQGEGDEYGTEKQVDGIARGVAGPVETLMLPDCGHSPHRDRPEAVLPAIRRFSASLA